MKEYHKIKTVFERDPATNFKTLLMGEYAMPEFAYLARNEWVFTEKVDGTNIRVVVANSVTFRGKTDAAQIPAFLVDRLNQRFLTTKVRVLLTEIFPDGACLYGEGYGAKIQKGGENYRQDQDFILFDVLVGECWLERENVADVARKLALDVVPIIGAGTLHDMVELARIGFQSTWGDFPAEGIVARPATELRTRSGHRIITKIKHRDFVNG